MKEKTNKTLAVCGYKAVKALASLNPQKIIRFYYNKERALEFGSLCKKLAENKTPYNQVESFELEKLAKSVHHQGLVAFIDEPKIPQLTKDNVDKFILNKETILYLDLVENTNNLGAIIRSAAFFGINKIIFPENPNQAAITTSAYRVAQGGMEFVHFYFVKSPEFFLKDISGKILRIGTDLETEESISKIRKKRGTGADKKPALVILGNEETGISAKIKKLCDVLIKIPGANTVQSLNVAQAASIIFWELTKK